MVDDIEPGAESDLRRRAAWLLAMLAVVAVLFIIVLTTVIHSGGGSGDNGAGPGPLDGIITSSPTPPASTSHPAPNPHTHSSSTTPATTSNGPSSPAPGQTTCPTQTTCILDGDLGNGIPAINAYRTQHGLPAVSGAVSPAAQQCALNNGNGCSGGWAETELSDPDGAAAVQKILPFAHLLDTQMKSVDVGWAYDPGAKLYYFAIVRND